MHLDKHTIIYGHYTERGYMFGDLDKYLDKGSILRIRSIEFSTPQGVSFTRFFFIHIAPKNNTYLDTTFEKTTFSDFANNHNIFVEGLKNLMSPNNCLPSPHVTTQ